jgi:hypothetical protein
VAFISTQPAYLVWSWVFSAAVMIVTIIRLLGDVFEAGNVTRDRLFACATIYLVMGLLWCYLYAIAVEHYPGSFTGLSTVARACTSSTSPTSASTSSPTSRSPTPFRSAGSRRCS